VRIAAMGAFLPERIVSNADLAAMGAPLTPEEIEKTSGIRTRHWVGDGEATSDLAVGAARRALQRAGLASEAIDRVLLATISPDYPSPATACLVQHALGLRPVPACDLAATCSGFLYALEAAARAVVTGDRHVLALAADVRSRYLDVRDRTTCGLFGDGAGAAIVSEGPVGTGLLGIGLLADGSGVHSVYVPAGGSREPASAETVAASRHTIRMENGPQVYLSAVEGMLFAARSLLEALGMSFSDVDLLVPHQANMHILRRVAWKAGIPFERVVVNIDRVGNISGATVAVAFEEAIRTGCVRPGSRVLLLAAGAGHTAGAALYLMDEQLLSRMTVS